ncbi:MAG: APC family permease [Ferrimicrobium sp.]|uniref:APC family permease n=1 Tax=Ferrimicrobium sp. TaxID=2926050 RepID=UPI0026071AAC|nr:APC family permease [Ferrimicrobium sp.]
MVQNADPGGLGDKAGATTGHYEQKLSRSLSTWGNIMITLSGVTPAVSVFAIAPVALVEAGSGTFLSFIFAAILGVVMALCWAELSSSYPISGGDYALVWHSFKGRAKPLAGPMSFITFALYVDFIAFIPATIALGAGEYLGVVFSVDAKILGAAIMILAALVAMLKIRFNAILTGIFLGIEMLALLTLTVLGIIHAHHFGALIHPQLGNSHSVLVPVAFSGVLALTAVAIFSYNGYANAVNFAEETKGSHRTIAKAILISLLITVVAELLPITAVIVGAPSLSKLTTSAIPLEYFIKATSSNTVYDIVAIGIALAVFNATLAIILSYARILFSASRDKAWPGKLSDWMAWVHPKTQSPWLPTAIVGVAGAILCLTVSLGTLANLTGASLVADYAIIAIAAIVARTTGATRHSHYRMPLWPLPPILAIAGLVYVFTQQTGYLLEVTLITIAIGLLYWLIVILPQKGKAWDLREIAQEGDSQ